jgi:NAD(P)-dependent dehydrogenase (short-subunit alcohol dehydrogenase family)
MTNPFYEATFGGKDAVFPKDFCPLERGGERMDIAGVALFMASPAAAYLSGSILLHDGGVLSLAQSTY